MRCICVKSGEKEYSNPILKIKSDLTITVIHKVNCFNVSECQASSISNNILKSWIQGTNSDSSRWAEELKLHIITQAGINLKIGFQLRELTRNYMNTDR